MKNKLANYYIITVLWINQFFLLKSSHKYTLTIFIIVIWISINKIVWNGLVEYTKYKINENHNIGIIYLSFINIWTVKSFFIIYKFDIIGFTCFSKNI